MEKAMYYLQKTKGTLRPLARMIGGLSFWMMALLCFGLRVFVKPPLGALLALIIGCVWAWKNMSIIRVFIISFRNRMVVNYHGYEKESLWFEYGGRDMIKALIIQLSAKGIYFCNLSKALSDLPPVSHWYAISSGLEVMGVNAQISGGAFYISWKLQADQSEKAESTC